jgi:myo-inositol-1(or 4)-monophosphatase
MGTARGNDEENTVPAVQSDIAKALLRLHAEVRRRVVGCDVDGAQFLGKNRKGDLQRGFDVAADVAVRRLLEEEFGSGIILSEESEDYYFGETAPTYRFIVDPVDGSDNWARGLPLSSVAVAVLAAEGPIALDQVVASLVGALDEEIPIVATRGEGTHRGTTQLQTSDTQRVADAFVSCELNHFAPTVQVGELFSTARAVRSYGCASRAIALVACGAIDAHIDVRSRLTPESFLAAAAILREAGGCVLDSQGNTLGKFEDLCQTTTIVATATEELASEIIDALA